MQRANFTAYFTVSVWQIITSFHYCCCSYPSFKKDKSRKVERNSLTHACECLLQILFIFQLELGQFDQHWYLTWKTSIQIWDVEFGSCLWQILWRHGHDYQEAYIPLKRKPSDLDEKQTDCHIVSDARVKKKIKSHKMKEDLRSFYSCCKNLF